MAILRVMSGPLAGQTIEVEGDLTIGRQNADITIEDSKLSRRHAVVRVLAEGLQVEDLGSSNGTFVDGERIEAPTVLLVGAVMTLGASAFVVEEEAMRASSQPLTAADRDATRAWTIQPGGTTVRPANSATATVEQSQAPSPAAGAPAAADLPLGEFRPPARKRRARLASRSWVPVALSFGTVVLTAVALVIYFAAR
jgi:pSer/pThr/pTyr-binding forkhead associated (FHA) protein